MARDSMTFKLFGQDVSLSKAFGKAGRDAEKFSKGAKKSIGGVGGAMGGLGLAAGGAAVGAFAMKSVGAFESAGKSSLTLQRYMGGTIEDASRMGHALAMSGLDADTAGKSLGIFSKHVAANDKSAKALGFSLKDSHGNLLPMSELIPKVADKFAKLKSGPEKTALAMKLFGRSGMTMMPFLSKGADGIKKLTDESDKLGTTLTEKDAQAVKDATANKRKMGEAVKGLQISIGRELLPKIQLFVTFLTERVVPAISKVVEWMQKHSGLVQLVAGVIVGLVIGIGGFVKVMQVVAAVTKAWSVAQGLLNLSFLTSPIFWIVLAVIALVVAIVIAYKKSETFRNIVQGAFHAVLGAVRKVWDWVKGNWPLLLAIIAGPIGLAVRFIVKHWDTIKDGAKTAVKWITDKFGGLITFFKSLPKKLSDAVKNLWSGLSDGFKNVLNFLIDGWNALDFGIHVHLPSWLGGAGLDIDDVIPDIPRLAAGGIVSSPTLALIGEAGPEAVVPLGKSGGVGQVTHVTISPNVLPGTEDVMARAIVKALNDYQRRGGRLAFAGS